MVSKNADEQNGILKYDDEKYFIEYFIFDAHIVKFKKSDVQKLVYQEEILYNVKTTEAYKISVKSVINISTKLKGRMQIFAKTMDGKVFSIDIRKSNKVIEIKYIIQVKLGLHPDEQILIYQNEMLDDDKTIDEYQICDYSGIDIVARLRGGMQLFARTLEGKTITLEALKSEKIINLKRKIQEKTGLNPNEQRLVYAGAILEDDKTIDDYQICEKYVINIVAGWRNKMQIFVKTMDGKAVAFKVEKSYKIIDIKYKIQEKIELHPDEQKLIYHGILLDDDNKTIDQYQICENSIINVVDKYHIFILAKPVEGINNAIFVHKSFRIIDIKKKIQEKIGLHPDDQKLIYRGLPLDDDDKTIDEYQICEKSVINVVVEMINGMQLFIKTIDGSKVIIYVQKSDKIRNVKVKIQEKLGLYSNEQKLVYQGRILEDDKIINEYGICDGSEINVDEQIKLINSILDHIMKKPVIYGTKLFAKIVEGKIISIFIGKKEKIKNIKWQINFQTGLHPDVQKLFYNGVVLEDEKIVNYYQISAQSTLEVVKMMEVFVKTLNGKIFSIYLLNKDSIRDVKCRIQEKTGLSRDEQILLYQNKLLDDDSKTVNQYQIREIAVINILVRLKNEIQIFVQISEQSIIPINILKTAKIIDVKSKFAKKTGMQFDENNLVYKNNILDDERLLIDYHIEDGSVISIDNSEFFLFIQAIKSESLEKVKSIYDSKFHNITNKRFSPIHYACKQDNADIVKFLIESNFKINTADQEYNMPIHYACINGCVKILKTLIRNKCKIEARDSNGMKPIHLACLNGNFENVKLLIENGCELESKDYLGRRPIHLACIAGNIDIVKLLIENKCKINVIDQSKKSPFNIAEKENHNDIIKIMDEEISKRMIEIIITELDLKCHNNCDHIFCQTSLRNKTFNKGILIGRGSSGKVYRCTLSQSSRQIATKKISKDKTEPKYIEGNINRFIKKIKHERIIKYFGAITREENIFIFMEFMSGGSLRSKIVANSPMESSKVIYYTMQILEGLEFLHENKIIHRDIKPDNILLDDDGNVKLTDLGLGLLLLTTDGQTKPANTFCGTAYYMAPEIINGEVYSYGADIWSLGATVIEMATGKYPYQGLVPQAAMFKIATNKTIPYQLPASSPNKIVAFLNRILVQEPSRRFSATNLINLMK